MTIRQKLLITLGSVLATCFLAQSAAAQGVESTRKVVSMQKVEFKNNTITMVGNLFTPAYFDKSKKYPAIVVTHPWGGVKEQTAGLYAKKLAEQGFVALAFDASHYGESGGEPRYVENPFERTEDIRSAVDYLSTLPQVNEDQIGALGICAGGGYTLSASQTDARIKVVAGISIFDVGAFSRDGLGNIWPAADRIKLMQDIAQQRTREARGEAPRIDRLVALAFFVFDAVAAEPYVQSQKVFVAGSQESVKGSGEFFTGNVRIDPLFPDNEAARFTGGKVTFEPGARSAWHIHPAGQHLILTAGTGWTQEWGGPIVEVHAGDVVWCPPKIKHWHGATPTTTMSHIAITGMQDGKNVEWLEKVSDEQYRK